MKTGYFHNIKVIVLVGYVLLFLLAFFGGYQVYRQLVKFSKNDIPKNEKKQLNLISNALVALYETESMRKVMLSDTYTNNSLDSSYNRLTKDIHFYLDSLYASSNDLVLHTSLDTVNVLLKEKEINLQNMRMLMDSIRKLPYSKQVLTTVLSKKDINDIYDIFNKNLSRQVNDSSFFIKKKKGFFAKLKDVFTTSQDSTQIVTKQNIRTSDSTYKTPQKLLTDTIVQYINDVSKKSDKKKAAYFAKLSVRQSKMLYYDALLTEQIQRILYEIEAKERKHVNELSLQREKAIRKSSQTVAFIALASLLTVVLFVFLSLGLINKSQEYRKKLEKSKKYAEDLLKSRERLLLMISHDIKSPLSSIIGHIELLSKENMPQKEKSYINTMRSSSEHILELVNKLMDYHKLEQGKSQLNILTFNPHGLMEDIYKSFVPSAAAKKLKFTEENRLNNQENFVSDPFTIKQIINNLLSNAIKFTFSGKIHFTSSMDKNNVLEVSVKDTGVGIKSEEQNRIFDEFSRVGDASTLQNTEGAGLGLAITYKLVKLLNGDIQVRSEYGKGTEFTVKLPLQPAKKSPDKGTKENTAAQTILKKNTRILFVDDDLAMLNVYHKLFENEGANVTLCSDSKKVLSLLKHSFFDIILTDIQMPSMNGFELVQKIREMDSEHYKTVPIIARSARTDISEEKFRAAGFTTFLQKPLPFNILIQKVAEFTRDEPAIIPSLIKSEVNSPKGIHSLIEFVEDDKETALDILTVFLSENEIKINELKEALANNHPEQLKNTAHKLLPLMRMIGAKRIVELALQIENGEKSAEKVNELIRLIEEKNKEIIAFIQKKYPA